MCVCIVKGCCVGISEGVRTWILFISCQLTSEFVDWYCTIKLIMKCCLEMIYLQDMGHLHVRVIVPHNLNPKQLAYQIILALSNEYE